MLTTASHKNVNTFLRLPQILPWLVNTMVTWERRLLTVNTNVLQITLPERLLNPGKSDVAGAIHKIQLLNSYIEVGN